MVFKTILVPYDGSAMSDKAVDKAVELAHYNKRIKNNYYSCCSRNTNTNLL